MQVVPQTRRVRPIIRVFVSSTFSDLIHERNALQDRVWPALEQYCLARGFQFHAIDLRWGVPTEAGLDHRTMRICMEELRRSQEVSPQPNFLIILGDRYGWQPLPEEIAVAEFETLQRAAGGNVGHRAILDAWYRRDNNAVPPVYLLRSRRDSPDGQDYTKNADGSDTEAWAGVQNVLWSLINRVFHPSLLAGRFEKQCAVGSPRPSWGRFPMTAFRSILHRLFPIKPASDIPAIVRFQGSATEQEIWHGAFRATDPQRHVIAFSRTISNLDSVVGHPRLQDFVNVDTTRNIDHILHEAVRMLKLQLRQTLCDNYLEPPTPAEIRPSPNGTSEPRLDVSIQHISSLCNQIEDRLKGIIQQQIEEYWRCSAPSGYRDTGSETKRDDHSARIAEIEEEEHLRFQEKQGAEASFVGRQESLQEILAYVNGDSSYPLVIHGPSGCGKTTLLARAAQECAKHRPVIVRFLGITPDSSDLRDLLAGICRELRKRNAVRRDIPSQLPELIEELTSHFRVASAERPVVLFLDALDQLSDADGARLLQWIPPGEMPKHVKLVLSCLSDRPKQALGGEPYAELVARNIPPTNFVVLDVLELKNANVLLFERWLPDVKRTVTSRQRALIEARLGSVACRQPLYLKILFEEVRLWKSFDDPEELGEGLSALLTGLISRLSRPENHGSLLVEHLLAYLAAARRGLTETEILEVLFADFDYRHALEETSRGNRHALPKTPPRIPVAIWSRLHSDLAPYLTSRAAPGGNVIAFYHRAVSEFVAERFLAACAWGAHARLADLFGTQRLVHSPSASGIDQRDDRLPVHNRVNLRKLDELPWQLAQSGQWKELGSCLADATFFDAAWQASEFEVRSYWTQVAQHLPEYLSQFLAAANDLDQDAKHARNLAMLLACTGHHQHAEEIRARLVEQARRGGDPRELGRALLQQSNVSWSRGDLEQALKLLSEARKAFEEGNDLYGVVLVLGNEGSILQKRGQSEKALGLHQRQADICRRLHDDVGLQVALGNIANIYFHLGHLDAAVRLYEEKEGICRRLGHLDGLSSALLGQSNVLHRRGDIPGALAKLKEGESLCEQVGNREGLVKFLGSQAELLLSRGDLREAMRLNARQAELCQTLMSVESRQLYLNLQANIFACSGDVAAALRTHRTRKQVGLESGDVQVVESARQSEATFMQHMGELDAALQLFLENVKSSDPGIRSDALAGVAGIYRSRGEWAKAIDLFKEQEQVSRQLNDPAEIGRSLMCQAQICLDMQDVAGAKDRLREAAALFEAAQNLRGQACCYGVQAIVARDLGDRSRALELLKKQEEISLQLGDKDGLARAVGDQGLTLWGLGELDKALELCKQAEAIHRELRDQHGLQSSLGNQALIFTAKGNFDAALERHREEERICRSLGDMNNLRICLKNMGGVLWQKGEIKQACRFLAESSNLARKLGLIAEAQQLEAYVRSAPFGG